ncbi:MAG: riboflavin biosynthesis protein RibD [Burkholderiales bacterium PBB3]|nr:MAG: riboflavin biosynthesis protein RibD [Burkholderiales bacterium PBB3]
MARAMALAVSAGSECAPNPRVGCVLVNPGGELIGEGRTQRVGGPHAEVMALRDAASRGNSTVGSTAYVTLEPCSHHGRTGPCCDALLAAGVRKVVASLEDPNPSVAGQGFAKLRAAGLTVDIGSGADESRELNLGFFSRMQRKMPWVRMKIAASIDGQTALADGSSQWITSAAARADGHAWRARACAVLTGMGTVRADNPRLDVRLAPAARQPHLVLVDSRLETPLDAHLFIAARALFIYVAAHNDIKKTALEALGAHIVHCPDHSGASHQVDLKSMLEDLARREVNEVHVEAGSILNGALLQAGLVDELLFYVAPKLIGPGRGMASLNPLPDLAAAIALQFHSVTPVGSDIRVLARVQKRNL